MATSKGIMGCWDWATDLKSSSAPFSWCFRRATITGGGRSQSFPISKLHSSKLESNLSLTLNHVREALKEEGYNPNLYGKRRQ